MIFVRRLVASVFTASGFKLSKYRLENVPSS